MSADDQQFLDLLSSVPNDIRRYSNDVADYVDKHLDHVSSTLREAISSSKWIPESARPKPPPPPPRPFIHPPTPTSVYAHIQNWITKHKVLTAVVVIVIGGVTYHIVKKKANYRKKRRAKRASNGARLEVVVVAGTPSEPISRSVAQDLERRGFIVYVICNSIEEEVTVQNEGSPYIKPLMIDIVDPESTGASIERFKTHLESPHTPFQGAKQHHFNLRSLILIPSHTYPSTPIANLSPTTLSDLLNTRLLTPILTLQSFLPLLQSTTSPKPSVLLLTPSIIPSLAPSFHLPESLISNALSTFSSTLSAELSPLSIPVTHLHLGTFDLSTYQSQRQQIKPYNSNLAAQRAETLKWDEPSRLAYARNFVSVNSRGTSIIGKGSSLRELNNAVFDALTSGRGGTVRVGMGSSVYGFVGKFVPRGLVAWMMGVRRVTDTSVEGNMEFGRRIGGSETGGSRGTSPGSSKSGVVGFGLDGSEYVPVYGNVPVDPEKEAYYEG